VEVRKDIRDEYGVVEERCLEGVGRVGRLNMCLTVRGRGSSSICSYRRGGFREISL